MLGPLRRRREREERLKNDPEFQEAAETLRTRIYDAADIIEVMERKGKVRGNGHHARQKLAEQAVQMLRERWN